MAKTIRESNPHDLKKYDEAPQNYISGDNLISLLKKYSAETAIPALARHSRGCLTMRFDWPRPTGGGLSFLAGLFPGRPGRCSASAETSH